MRRNPPAVSCTTVFLMSQSQNADADMVTGEGRLFLEEQKQIQEMAVGGPAVFLGHCAAEALKDKQGLVRVFIRCSGEAKKKRIQEDYLLPPEKMESIRKFFDRKRAAYYKANTSRDWRDPEIMTLSWTPPAWVSRAAWRS